MADKRKRGQNFTLEEKDRLVKLLLEHKDTILNKRTNGATNESKALAWISVTNAFNSSGTVYRNKDSLMKIWEKLKSESKIYYSASRRDTSLTGGGPSVIKIDPILEQVSTILGRGCTGIKGVPDSDNPLNETETVLEEFTFEPVPKVICVEHEGKDNFPSDPPNTPSFSKVELSEEHIRKTPLWSRRRPQLAQNNERVEAVSNLCDSFKEVNKKKEIIENIKCQLLQEELEFKRKLFEFQLQAAAKEVEIKNEILTQIKAGALGLQALFVIPQNKKS